MEISSTVFGDPLVNDIVPKPHTRLHPEFDITAMIDLVSLMNIYFLITFVGVAKGLDLPTANHCAALDGEVATVITMVVGNDGVSAVVYLGDGKESDAIQDPVEQQKRIAAEVEKAVGEGRTAVLIKAEKNLRLREIARISGAAMREGVTLHMGVIEKDVGP